MNIRMKMRIHWILLISLVVTFVGLTLFEVSLFRTGSEPLANISGASLFAALNSLALVITACVVFLIYSKTNKSLQAINSSSDKLIKENTDLTREIDQLTEILNDFLDVIHKISIGLKQGGVIPLAYPYSKSAGHLETAYDDLREIIGDYTFVVQESEHERTDFKNDTDEIIAQIERFTEELIAGNLSYRADASKLKKQAFQNSVNLLNTSLEALDGLDQEFESVIGEITNGNISARISGNYQGIFKKKKDQVNRLGETLQSLKEIFFTVSEEITTSNMSGADTPRVFKGDFGELTNEIKKIRNIYFTVFNQVEYYVENLIIGEDMDDIDLSEYQGRTKQLMSNLMVLRDNTVEIYREIMKIGEQAVKGDLSVRIDLSKFGEDDSYGYMMLNLNNALDAILSPIQESAAVIEELAKGNLKARVLPDYQGDHAKIKNNLNQMGERFKGYIDEISDALLKMSNKNFEVKIEREYQGDFIELKKAINHIAEQISDVLSQINSASEQVESGASEVASSSQSLSQGTTQQAMSVEEMNTTVNQLAKQANENASNADTANSLSLKSKEDALQGNAQMKDMLEAMNEIKSSSKSINGVSKVIADIAFQSNILALNAAVEASRAGLHGKGFAVVAEEVRNLAARSAKAAKEITDMIDESINKVERGSEIANKTANSLSDIANSITETVKIVELIAESSDQQTIAISQVREGIGQIAKATQLNASTAEESAAASQEMSAQAQMLKELIQQFKIKANEIAFDPKCFAKY